MANAARAAGIYVLIVVAGVGLFALVRSVGTDLPAQAPVASTFARMGHGTFAQVLLAMALIATAARGVGRLFERYLTQPPVLGEIVAGIALGPSVLGALWPAAHAVVFPREAATALGAIARLGVVLFMFLVGLELDPAALRGRGTATLTIAHASIVAPFVLGAALAVGIFPTYGNGGSFTVFALFVGTALSVTAFPVLARILADRKLTGTPLGTLALACAAADDVTAWCMLAAVSGFARAQTDAIPRTFGLVALHIAGLALVARPLLARLADREERRDGDVSQGAFATVLIAALLSAAATDAIGVHAFFGAFFLGVMTPAHGRLATHLEARLAPFVGAVLLPVYFALTGLRVQLGLLTLHDLATTGVVIVVATVGKVGGTWATARALGIESRTARALGVLMNARGLMGILVLDAGVELGVLTPKLFAVMVLTAIATTMATSPLLRRLA